MTTPSQQPRPSLFEQQLRSRQKRVGRMMVLVSSACGLLAVVAVWFALRPDAGESGSASDAAGALRPARKGEPSHDPGRTPSGSEQGAGGSVASVEGGPSGATAAQAAAAPVANAPVAGAGGAQGIGAVATATPVPASKPGQPAARPGRPVAPKSDGLTAEQRAVLARMGAGDSHTSPVASKPAGKDDSGGKKTPGLSAAQLSSVVARGRPNLQRCYETALRGSGAEQAVRTDISISVSPAGSVTRVTSAGASLPGMEACIARTVRAWQFPSASEATETKFPIVFQPGS